MNLNNLFKRHTIDIFISTILIGVSFNLALFIYKVRKSAAPIQNQYYFSSTNKDRADLNNTIPKLSNLNEKNLPEENSYEINLQVGEKKEIDLDTGRTLKEDPLFTEIINNKFILSPSKKDIGVHNFTLISDTAIPSVYKVTVSINTVDMESLKNEVSDILGKDTKNYGVYLYDITRNSVLGINHDKVLPPASISKIPIAILALRDVDSGKLKLDQKYQLKKKNQIPGDALSKMKSGSYLTLDQYINYMIVQSDNTAMTTIEEILGGAKKINERSKTELGIINYFRDPHQATAEEVGNILLGIYNQKYLSQKSNDYLLNYLKNTGSWLQDRIPAKLPKNIEVAHKIGQISTQRGCACEDAGIVYGEKADFIVVVLNEDTTMPIAREKISTITKVTYDYLNK